MDEIIGAVIGGVFALVAAVLTVWLTVRSTSERRQSRAGPSSPPGQTFDGEVPYQPVAARYGGATGAELDAHFLSEAGMVVTDDDSFVFDDDEEDLE